MTLSGSLYNKSLSLSCSSVSGASYYEFSVNTYVKQGGSETSYSGTLDNYYESISVSVVAYANSSKKTIKDSASTTIYNSYVTYTVSLSSNPSTGGSTSGGGTFESGASCKITATPAANYVFTSWTGDRSSTSNPYSFNVYDDYSITANFTYVPPTPTYTVDVYLSDGTDHLDIQIGGKVYTDITEHTQFSATSGTYIAITGYTKSGYYFTSFGYRKDSGDRQTTASNPFGFYIDGNYTVSHDTAEIPDYTLSYDINGGYWSGGVAPSSQSGKPGSKINLAYTATAKHYAREDIVSSTYNVIFNSNGGSSVPTKASTVRTTTTTPVNCNGWQIGSTVYTGGSRYTFGSADVTAYAHWIDGTPTTTTTDSGVSEPTAPTQSGYNFLGWFTSRTGGTQITSWPYKPGTETTLYAHWERSATRFTWWGTDALDASKIASGEPITNLTADSWNRFNTYISNYIDSSWGHTVVQGGSITAAEFNLIRNELYNKNVRTYLPGPVTQGEIVYATLFENPSNNYKSTSLKNALNNYLGV